MRLEAHSHVLCSVNILERESVLRVSQSERFRFFTFFTTSSSDTMYRITPGNSLQDLHHYALTSHVISCLLCFSAIHHLRTLHTIKYPAPPEAEPPGSRPARLAGRAGTRWSVDLDVCLSKGDPELADHNNCPRWAGRCAVGTVVHSVKRTVE